MFNRAIGLDYREYLAALHDQLRFDWYLEIGSQTGRSLALSRSPSIAAFRGAPCQVTVRVIRRSSAPALRAGAGTRTCLPAAHP